ncbi:MAG: hypothetical protein SH868_16265 [Bythopirellula sp.]|nr:hypothetical protein [Bythopirellula sp.]
MHIDLSSYETENLTRHAAAAGFASVEQFVTQLVHTLAERPNVDDLFTPLDDKELAQSLAMIDRGMKQIQAGEGLGIDEARQCTLARLGLGGA